MRRRSINICAMSATTSAKSPPYPERARPLFESASCIPPPLEPQVGDMTMGLKLNLAAAAALAVFAASPARAQDTSSHKPGGLNKIAHNVSNTFKKAGRDTKA